MIDDPVVQILREAAARGRQLRLTREQAARNETRSESDVTEARLSDQLVGITTILQHNDDAVVKESST